MSKYRNYVDQEELRRNVAYDEDTGIFIRLIGNGPAHAGDVAGHIENTGYRVLWVNGCKYLAHRLAWLYVTGKWPENQIDHINGIRNDNRFTNLREATNAENQQNRKPRKSLAGLLGVSRNKKRWKAEIIFEGIKHHIGTFDTPEEAHEAYINKKKDLHRWHYAGICQDT